MTSRPDRLVEVELRDLPVAVWARAQEHSDGLMREFALIAGREANAVVPRRLLDLAERLQMQYGDYTAGATREFEEALGRGQEFITLHLKVPAAARDAAVELADMLAEADDYCRRGEMLSLVPSAAVLRFRAWYIGQFVRQIDGQPPVSWHDGPDPGSGGYGTSA